MPASREQICATTAARIAAGRLAGVRAVVGLDGFVDEIIAVVETRQDLDRFDPVPTIAAMAEKLRLAAGESSNYELVVRARKLGGNGPILANALACLGLDVSYIGCLGYPQVHPVFHDFAARARVRSIAEPGHTDALEFQDGKIMLGKYETLREVTWENLVARVGRDELTNLLTDAALVGLVNWTMLPHMSAIWERLLAEVFPRVEPRARALFFDLADPEKRTAEDLRGALALLARFQEHAEVTLGMNLKEALEVARALGLPAPAATESASVELAASIREALGIGCAVVHPRRAAAAATAEVAALFPGPFLQNPLISTGAGDHFNAGFCLGRLLGLTLEESLCAGVSASGYYVRTARSPSAAELAAFAAELPPPEA